MTTTIAAPDAIPGLIDQLRTIDPPGGRVLSAYLSAPLSRSPEQIMLQLRDHVKVIRASLPADEHAAFEAAVNQAEQIVAAGIGRLHRGLALYSTGTPDYAFAIALPARPEPRVEWEERPVTAPLQAIADRFGRAVLVLFDSRHARVIVSRLGRIVEQHQHEAWVPPKHKGGGWFALDEHRAVHHREELLHHHADRVATEVLSILRRLSFDWLFLAGPAEPVAVLRHRLPQPLLARFGGVVHLDATAGVPEIVAAVEAALTDRAEQADAEAVNEMLEAVGGGRAVAGSAGSLDALTEGRAGRLLVAEGLSLAGAICRTCGVLYHRPGSCPYCGKGLEPLNDIVEAALARANATGAKVEIIRGPAAARLRESGGIAAWLR